MWQCRCITSDSLADFRIVLHQALSLSPVSPRFRFFLRFRLLERERGPGFEAREVVAATFHPTVQSAIIVVLVLNSLSLVQEASKTG